MRTAPVPAKAVGRLLLTSCHPPKGPSNLWPCSSLGGKGREKTDRGGPFLTGARGLYYWIRAPDSRYSETKADLLFEVANGVLVGIGEEVKDAMFDVVLL